MAWNHRAPTGGVHENEGVFALLEGLILMIALIIYGLDSTNVSVAGISFSGWAGIFAGLLFSGFLGIMYALYPRVGRYDVVAGIMLLGIIFGFIVEDFYHFAGAVVNASFNNDIIGIIGEILLWIAVIAMNLAALWASERKGVY